jgi:hypothetical protein
MSQFSRDLFYDARWTAVTKLDIDTSVISTWDPTLERDVRLLVPIDVQALVVAPDSAERMVSLVSPVNDLTGKGPAFPKVFDDGEKRQPGVYLHWAMPDALLRGTFGDAAATATAGNALALRPLPDRWVVLRLLAPLGASGPAVRGWVIEADTARVTALAHWPTNAAASQPLGATIEPDRLTGSAGGSVTWTTTYDSVVGRFALYDPLDDVATVAPQGVDGNAATYVVAGWWSKPGLDPLDAARDRGSLDELLHGLGWTAVPQWHDAGTDQRSRDGLTDARKAAGLYAKAEVVQPPVAALTSKALVTAFDRPATATFAAAGSTAFRFVAWWPHASLLHGSVYGVPIATPTATAIGLLDNRPDPASVRVALGAHDDDVVGALVSSSFGSATEEARRDTERIFSAFTSQLLRNLSSADGAVAVEEHEHHAAFGSLPGGALGTDRLLTGQSRTTRTAGRSARREHGDLNVGAKTAAGDGMLAKATALFQTRRALLAASTIREIVSAHDSGTAPEAAVAAEPRVVEKQAPRYHFPLDPLVAVQGARRSLRHGNDTRFSSDGRMWCRWPYQTQRQWQGLVRGDQLIPTLGNGAVPSEVLQLAQEAIVSSPYHRRWLADVAGAASGVKPGIVKRRLDAEAAIRFGAKAVYDGRTTVLGTAPLADHERADAFDQALAHSLLDGAEPYPLGVTLWSQPWVPQWIEWEAEVAATPTLDGWTLGPVDLHAADPVAALGGPVSKHVGRTMLSTGAARTLSSAVTDFLAAEDKLEHQTGGLGEIDETTEGALAAIAVAAEHLDLLTGPLAGLRLTWLGLGPDATVDGVTRNTASDGTPIPPAPVGPPLPLVSGAVRLTALRLLDTFGRTVDLSAQLPTVAVATRNDAPTQAGALALYPRLPRPARWMFRLVDSSTVSGTPGTDAFIDQVDPASQVNPVAGFVLPDHLDESLELFDAAGQPIGELFHAALSGQVVWEIAPGRAGPPDSGPLFDLAPEHAPVGRFAAGLVAADVKARADGTAGKESALSAALRAIDTTLWTVDTFASLGSEHIAGLVGRPMAVVRAQLWLELQAETGFDLTDAGRAAERVAAEQALAAVPFPVRLGELTRVDDGLLGFFVDDDYEHFHLVEATIADMAKPAGPTGQRDSPVKIDHPYLTTKDTLFMHYGQRLTLTLLMHPASAVHLTSGILPRKSLQLARDWVAPGLAVLAPSLRTGPLLIDPDKVRLPKPTVFGANQRFTHRRTPAEWQDDPILAATQTALLPDAPSSVQEGWIRVMPEDGAPA